MTMNLNPNEIHLWSVGPETSPSDREWDTYLTLLSTEEQTRHQRFHFAKDRQQYLLARALLRTTLSYYQPTIRPNEWQFGIEQYGKPFIQNNITPALYFNLSHTQGLIALAVSQDANIGVDVEMHERGNDLQNLAQHCYTPAELAYLYDDENAFRERFFSLWTLKEAFIKAVGKGLSMGLQTFEFHFSGPNIRIEGNSVEAPDSWYFCQWQPSPVHTLAIAQCRQAPLDQPKLRCFTSHPMRSWQETPDN